MIGALIQLFRKERGIGVIELSKRLGINRISLFRIEKGERQPSETTAIEAFKALGLSEEHIYQIFVFNDLMKWGTFAKNTNNIELQRFLKRLHKKEKNSELLHGYFAHILYAKRNADKKTLP